MQRIYVEAKKSYAIHIKIISKRAPKHEWYIYRRYLEVKNAKSNT